MSKGRARLAMSHGLSAWLLDAPEGFGDAGLHSHHAIQLTACLDGDLAIYCCDGEVRGKLLAVAADAQHRFEARGRLLFVFVEPESRPGRALTQALFKNRQLATLDPALLDALPNPLRSSPRRSSLGSSEEQGAPSATSLPAEALLAAAAALVGAIAPADTAPSLPDPRIQVIIDYAVANLDRPLSLHDQSHGVFLSASRLRHLFVEHTGLSFKTYLLWLRLVRAVTLYSDGATLTEAAHSAGFSDSAHFSRIFKRTFGLPATTLTRI